MLLDARGEGEDDPDRDVVAVDVEVEVEVAVDVVDCVDPTLLDADALGGVYPAHRIANHSRTTFTGQTTAAPHQAHSNNKNTSVGWWWWWWWEGATQTRRVSNMLRCASWGRGRGRGW
jgi:hypothetical protein